MRVDCGFKGHERNASIFIGFPLQMARNQFEGNLTWVRIPPAAPKIRPSAFGRWSYFWVPLPGVAPPQGDRICSGQVNCPCAKALLRKILVTPDFRRCWTPACGANLPHLFFTFPKRTVGQIDKYSGFWYNEYKKRRICHCTLPIQGLLLSDEDQF